MHIYNQLLCCVLGLCSSMFWSMEEKIRGRKAVPQPLIEFCANGRCLLQVAYLPLYEFIVRSAPIDAKDRIASPNNFSRSGILLFSSSEKLPRT